jgi:hypothetical protein
MLRALVIFTSVMLTSVRSGQEKPAYPSIDYRVAYTHELKPHRRTFPMKGIEGRSNQISLTLVVSPQGDVVDAKPSGDGEAMKFWPKVREEVQRWKFLPFERDGKAITVRVEEYVDLTPPERLPSKHVPAPVIQKNSKIEISLRRTACFGACPSYLVTVTTEGIKFEGQSYVVARGKHSDIVDVDEVFKLAQKFVASDFYSMDGKYRAGVTDSPTHVLSITIDGQKKEVLDYVGSWVGMPAVITELEEEVDTLARSMRWVDGRDGLIQALQAEKFEFHTFEAQFMLKVAANRGRTDTVHDFLAAGVPLQPIGPTKPPEMYSEENYLLRVGWLTCGARYPEVLQTLMEAGASRDDQRDKDQALAAASGWGDLKVLRALVEYGANVNARDGRGETPIFNAANEELMQFFIDHGADLTIRNDKGETVQDAAGIHGPAAREEALRKAIQRFNEQHSAK